MNLELRHLKVVCAIAETGSVTKAASQLGLAQTALTAQLQRIERTLGGPLFERLRESDAFVVAVSPLAAPEIASELGAHAFLRKPIDSVALISTVRDLLGTSALTRQTARASRQ